MRDNASLRDFNEGEGARVVDALERSLLLSTDMAELNSLTNEQVFLSLKRYVGMVRAITSTLLPLFFSCWAYCALVILAGCLGYL